jgi:hypothetical protein
MRPCLDLDVSEAVEALLGDITGEHAEGIEEAEGGGLRGELFLKGANCRGGLGW